MYLQVLPVRRLHAPCLSKTLQKLCRKQQLASQPLPRASPRDRCLAICMRQEELTGSGGQGEANGVIAGARGLHSWLGVMMLEEPK